MRVSGGGGGGKGRGFGDDGGIGNDRIIMMAFFGAIGLLGTFAYYEMSYKEITWKDFLNTYNTFSFFTVVFF